MRKTQLFELLQCSTIDRANAGANMHVILMVVAAIYGVSWIGMACWWVKQGPAAEAVGRIRARVSSRIDYHRPIPLMPQTAEQVTCVARLELATPAMSTQPENCQRRSGCSPNG